MFAFTAEVIERQGGGDHAARPAREARGVGFQIEPHHSRAASLEEVQEQVTEMARACRRFPSPPTVWWSRSTALHCNAELGTISDREPRWAIARKFAPE